MNFKSKDLRIGNWVLCNGFRTIINEMLMISIIKNDIQWTIDHIPITEEWLLKFGFEKLNECYVKSDIFKPIAFAIEKWEYNENQCEPIVYWSCLLFDKRDDEDFNCKKFTNPSVKYIHQLQNLYFVLTGEEIS